MLNNYIVTQKQILCPRIIPRRSTCDRNGRAKYWQVNYIKSRTIMYTNESLKSAWLIDFSTLPHNTVHLLIQFHLAFNSDKIITVSYGSSNDILFNEPSIISTYGPLHILILYTNLTTYQSSLQFYIITSFVEKTVNILLPPTSICSIAVPGLEPG